MSERTGLDNLEVAALRGIRAAGGRAGERFVKTQKCVVAAEAETGFGRRYLHEAMVAMNQRWGIAHPLVANHGNFGTLLDSPSEPLYTECRLTPLGELALEVEDSDSAAIPLGLLSGDSYKGGTAPALPPSVFLDGLEEAAKHHIDDAWVIDAFREPLFSNDPIVEGDCAGLFKGERVSLTLFPHFGTVASEGGLSIHMSRFPPGLDLFTCYEELEAHIEDEDWGQHNDSYSEIGKRLPITRARVYNPKSYGGDYTEIYLDILEGADYLDAIRSIRSNERFQEVQALQFTASVSQLVNGWVDRYWVDSKASVARLRALTVSQLSGLDSKAV